MRKVAIVTLVETDSSAWIMGNLNGLEPEKADMELIGREVRKSGSALKLLKEMCMLVEIFIPLFSPWYS